LTGLAVKVGYQDFMTAPDKADAQVCAGNALAYAAFLIDNRVNTAVFTIHPTPS